MRGLRIVAALCVLTVSLAACAACPQKHDGASSDSVNMTTCACAAGKTGGTAWCDKCNVGFVNGEKVECKGCYVEKTGGAACPMCSGAKK